MTCQIPPDSPEVVYNPQVHRLTSIATGQVRKCVEGRSGWEVSQSPSSVYIPAQRATSFGAERADVRLLAQQQRQRR
jgi:hypothetical protein